jgi:hypothetical protein
MNNDNRGWKETPGIVRHRRLTRDETCKMDSIECREGLLSILHRFESRPSFEWSNMPRLLTQLKSSTANRFRGVFGLITEILLRESTLSSIDAVDRRCF